MDAHRVEVLDRADDDGVAARVGHHLELVLLPAREILLDQHLPDGAHRKPVRDRLLQLLRRPGDAAPGAAERERRPDDRGHGEVHVGRVRDDAARRRQPDGVHRRPEALAVLGAVDRLQVGADQLDPERGELDRQVQRRLAAERRQDRVGPLALDHLGDRLGVERLEVGRVRPLGVGHDRRRVRVDEHDAVPLAPEHPAGLCARVVELARLADADRPGAEDQDRAKVGALRHRSASRSKKGRASSGPGDASGWNWTLSNPSPRRPSQVPSFSDTCELSPFGPTAKPWFWTVTSTRPVRASCTGMIRAAVAEGELEGLVPEGEPEQLMAEADTEERRAAEQCADRLDLGGQHRRVAGAVRDQHRARLGREDRVRAPLARDDVGLEAGVGEPARDRPLRAEVDDDDARAGADRRRPRSRRPGGRAAGRRSAARRAPARAAPRPSPRRARSGGRRRRGSCARASACRRRSSATTPRSRSQAANSGRTSRMTTPSHCTGPTRAGSRRRRSCRSADSEAQHLGDVARIGRPPPRSRSSRS